FICADDLNSDPEAPALIDLADLNIAHYRVTADYEHGCHFTGLPQAIIAGYQKESDSEKLYIGGPSAWVFSDPQAKGYYMEFTGQGLGALENNLNRKEEQMSLLGARMLMPEKRGIEAADTANIHRAGESSVLASISQNVSLGLTKALQVFSQWAGYDQNVSIEINRDFMNVGLSPQEITALMGLVQAGYMSPQTLYFNLNNGELYPESWSFEEEQASIDNSSMGNPQTIANNQAA
ncbi:MAG: DUF4055 domain-containing protein, partial [Methylococcaceae bacterium]|nr:DUF4055 domain-containing protein [Methylococcaceae bacterium]